jgi:hypothetical protein
MRKAWLSFFLSTWRVPANSGELAGQRLDGDCQFAQASSLFLSFRRRAPFARRRNLSPPKSGRACFRYLLLEMTGMELAVTVWAALSW